MFSENLTPVCNANVQMLKVPNMYLDIIFENKQKKLE